MKLRSLASSTSALQLLPALLATPIYRLGVTLGLPYMGLAAIYSSIGHAHMVILTFWAFYLQHQFTVYCIILCFSLLSSRMAVCEVLIDLHHGNYLMNSIVISL